MSLIVFQDAEALLVQYLATITDAHVSTDVPDPRPDTFVTVQRAGGGMANLITDAPVLIIQAWAQSKEDAYDLCKLIRAHVNALARNGLVDWANRVDEAAGPGYLPDPDSETPRYQLTIQILVRGEQI